VGRCVAGQIRKTDDLTAVVDVPGDVAELASEAAEINR